MTASNKTMPTSESPLTFIESVENHTRRQDALTLLSWFENVVQLKPRLWGSSIIGYGRYHYRYESGREGEFMLTGFSPRKSAMSIYIMPGYRDFDEPLSRLGKHKIGKSCLYVNKLADIEMAVLQEIVIDGVAYMREHYDTWDE